MSKRLLILIMSILGKIKGSAGSSLKRIGNSTESSLIKVGLKEDDSPRESIKPFIAFTRKFEDNSVATGYQFIFYCDIGGEEYKTGFYESRSKNRSEMLGIIGRGVTIGASVSAKFNPLATSEREKDILENKSESIITSVVSRYGEMSAHWHQEHQEAFEMAQSYAKQYFKQCTICKRWACDYCWNVLRGICNEDALKFILCSQCNQLTSTGKFCKNCGTLLTRACPKCNSVFESGTKFCAECGTQLTH
jgi:RNA polymerase subunit RPABC4/transcription elongation factor Spt4